MTAPDRAMRSNMILGLELLGRTVYRSPDTNIIIVDDGKELTRVLPIKAYRPKVGAPIVRLYKWFWNEVDSDEIKCSQIGIALLGELWLIPVQDIMACKTFRLGERYDCYKVREK